MIKASSRKPNNIRPAKVSRSRLEEVKQYVQALSKQSLVLQEKEEKEPSNKRI